MCIRDRALDNGLSAAHRFDLPGERENIAPMAVGMEQGSELWLIGRRERFLELAQPVGRRPLDVLGGTAHGVFHAGEYAMPIDRNRAGVPQQLRAFSRFK